MVGVGGFVLASRVCSKQGVILSTHCHCIVDVWARVWSNLMYEWGRDLPHSGSILGGMADVSGGGMVMGNMRLGVVLVSSCGCFLVW